MSRKARFTRGDTSTTIVARIIVCASVLADRCMGTRHERSPGNTLTARVCVVAGGAARHKLVKMAAHRQSTPLRTKTIAGDTGV